MSGKESKLKNNQSSKSTSSSPHREFPAATSAFSGLAILVLVFVFSIFLGTNTYASSISISLSGNVSLNLLKDNANPVFSTSTVATANVTSDHYTGYTLTIAGSNDTGRLVSSNNQNRYLSSIGEAINENTFRMDSNYNDKWGFLPSKYNSLDNSNYQPSPTTTATTMDVTNTPNPSGTDYTLALGAKVTPSMALDSYGQTFVLAATGNGYDYHIGFTDNSATLPDDIYGNSPQSDTVALPSERPTKSGFVFGGWCSVATTVNADTHETICPSGETVYQPGDPVTLAGDSANNMLMYAIWTKGYETFADAFVGAGKTDQDKVNGYYKMQDITPSICDSIITGSPAITADIAKNTLIDTRNNKTYLVAKYADGHCWMRENLNLPLTKNTNVVAYDFAADDGRGATFNYSPAYTTQTTNDSWQQNASDGARSYGVDKDKYIGGTNIATAASVATSGQPYDKIGILYNWAAATAQTGAAAAAATTKVSTSICPKGWRLPATAGNYSFSVLMGSYGLPTINQSSTAYSGQLQNPLNFNRTGYYSYDSVLTQRGIRGGFWADAGNGSILATYFGFYSGDFVPQNGYYKGSGFAIRCVAV